jgi:chaperonin cofactor prefoldin
MNATTIEEIRRQFNADLESDAAQVTLNPIHRTNFNELAEMCCAEHRRFVCHMIGATTADTATDFTTEYETRINENLRQLEILEHIRVTAKKEKKTEMARLKKVRREMMNSVLPPAKFEEYGEGFVKIDAPEDHATVKELSEVIKQRKKNYQTTRDHLMKQMDDIQNTLRREFRDYTNATETAIGAIIAHAEKCRAYIQKCRKYALLEYAAAEWWHANEYPWIASRLEEEMINDENVTIRIIEYKFHLAGAHAFNPTTTTDATCYVNPAVAERLQFIVTRIITTEDDEEKSVIEVAKYDVTPVFQNIILTKEAIEGFEWAETEMWYQAQQMTEDAAATTAAAAQNVDVDVMEE